MSKTINNGFLGLEINYEREKYRKKYVKEYEVIYALNDLAYQIIKNPGLKTIPLDVFVLTNFIFIHNSFQSSIILLEMGLYEDSRNIARSIYEKLFNIKYIVNNEDALAKFQNMQDKEMLTMFNYIKNNQLFKIIPEEANSEYINQLEAKISKDLKKYPTFEIISNSLNMKEEYAFYKILCNYTHSNISIIQPRINFNDDKTVVNGWVMHGESNFELSELIRCFNLAIFEFLNYINNDKFNEKYLQIQEMMKNIF